MQTSLGEFCLNKYIFRLPRKSGCWAIPNLTLFSQQPFCSPFSSGCNTNFVFEQLKNFRDTFSVIQFS